MKSKRFEVLSQRPVNQDGYVKEWVEEGFDFIGHTILSD